MHNPYPDEPRGGAPPAPPHAPSGQTDTAVDRSDAEVATEAGTVGDLVSAVSNDISTLFQQEVALAKAELRDEAQKAARSAGMFGAAAAAGYFMLLFVLLAAMFGLAEVMAYGWASLIVAGVLGLAAALLALRGRSTARSMHPTPTRTVETLKEDVQWARNRTR